MMDVLKFKGIIFFYMFETLQYPSNEGISQKNQWILTKIKECIECILELKEERE